MITIGMIVATIRSVEWSEPFDGRVNTGEFDGDGVDVVEKSVIVVPVGNSGTVVAVADIARGGRPRDGACGRASAPRTSL